MWRKTVHSLVVESLLSPHAQSLGLSGGCLEVKNMERNTDSGAMAEVSEGRKGSLDMRDIGVVCAIQIKSLCADQLKLKDQLIVFNQLRWKYP